MDGRHHVVDQQQTGPRAAESLKTRSQTIGALPEATRIADGYLGVAQHGLRSMYDAGRTSYPQTARGAGNALAMEGTSLRYTAIAALGIGRLDEQQQRDVLAGALARDLIEPVISGALAGSDPGAVALATWLAAELGAVDEAQRGALRISELVRTGTPIPTVDQSWMLTALVEHGRRDESGARPEFAGTCVELAGRLLRHQAAGGIFPHVLPPQGQHPLRAHVGCFADQVYPIQALARYSAAVDDAGALAAANRCAQRICELQGQAGQWWWHYDARTSDVIEGYPVYSVHQHAMAPMALFDLYEAGGDDHRAEVALGLDWIKSPPELPDSLVSEELGVIWRKIGRREPPKAMRSLRSVSTALRPGLRFSILDPLFPPVRVDHECRPYELGWLLYAWVGASAGPDNSSAGA